MLNTVPVVSAVLGSRWIASCAGLSLSFQCYGRILLRFVAGPKVVEQATGRSISKEELGDERIQVKNGVIMNLAMKKTLWIR